MERKIVDHLLEHRRLHLIGLLLLTAFFMTAISGVSIGEKTLIQGLRVDNSLEVWYRDDDPNWLTYREFQEQFERDEIVFLSFKSEDVFRPEILEKIKDLTEKLEALPYVDRVVSLTNVEHFQGDDGILRVSDLVEEIPEDEAGLRSLREKALSNPLYRDNILSADGATTAILVRLEEAEKGVNVHRRVTDLMEAFCERESEEGKYTFHLAGVPILVGLEDRASTDDAVLEYTLSFFFVVAVLYFMYRRWIYVFISLAVVVIANIWIHGMMALCGSTYNMISTILATLVMVIGIADSIHFISDYGVEVRERKDPKESVRRAFSHIVLPCLFTSLTTAAGFSSMVTSSLKAVREFGVYAAVAMLMTFVVNMVLVTICLSYLKPPKREGRLSGSGRLRNRYLNGVAALNRRHVKVNIALAVLVFLVSLTGIVRIQINTHEIKYFRKNHPVRVATDFIEQNLTGTIPLEIMLSGEPDVFKEPEILEQVEKLERFLASEEHVQKAFSFVDYLKEINRVVNDEDPSHYVVPRTREMVAQLLLLAEGSETEELENYVDITDYSRARVQGRLNYVDTNEMKRVYDRIADKTRELFETKGIHTEFTGGIPMYLNMVDYILESQIYGFSLALVIIFIMLSILVRSIRLGLLTMVPNCIPIFLTFGIMGWFGIYLDMGTVLIASIAIGLAVDDTIHFIARFRSCFERLGNYEEALDETIRTVGSPITATSLVLFFGFGVMMVSTFKPVVYFGLLAAVTMISALIADLFVLPALIKVFRPYGPERTLSSPSATGGTEGG